MMEFKRGAGGKFMRQTLFLTLAWALSAYATHAANNAIILKAKDGQTIIIGYELVKKSGLLEDMQRSGMLELQPKDDIGRPTMEFAEFDINQLGVALDLLTFAQLYPIQFPQKPTLQDRKVYQNRIEQIVNEFKKLYSDARLYSKIFEVADFFDISVIKEIMGQIALSPDLDLKMLEGNQYPSFGSASFQDAIALQMKRRMDLEKERYFVRETLNQYFKGISIQDMIDHGEAINYRDGHLDLTALALNSLEGLDKLAKMLGPITSINLSNTWLRIIPDNTYGVDTVRTLRLRGNDIRVFPNRFVGWDTLQELDLSSNQIEVIPAYIMGLPNLKTLDLGFNKIKKIPFIRDLPKLTRLNLSYNKIKSIPNDIPWFDALELLELNGNNIEDVPEDITGLPSLKALQLDNISDRGGRNMAHVRKLTQQVKKLRCNLSKRSNGGATLYHTFFGIR